MSPITNSYGTRNALAEGADSEPGTLASSVIDQRETRRDALLHVGRNAVNADLEAVSLAFPLSSLEEPGFSTRFESM